MIMQMFSLVLWEYYIANHSYKAIIVNIILHLK